MSWDSFPILPYCYNRCVGIHEAWYLASAPGRCHCICRPYDWNDVASVLPQVAFHYHRKTGIHYIHLWTSPLSFTLSLLPARWSHSWLELFQTLKPNPQKLTRPRYLPANPNPYWPASPVSNYRQNVVFHQSGYLYWYFPSAPTLSPGLRTLLLESRLVCPLLPLPLALPPQLWMVQQIFALMPCFKRTLTLLLVLIIRIILSTYKFFPSSYAFFIISTWSSAVFAALIPLPPTMPFKEALP